MPPKAEQIGVSKFACVPGLVVTTVLSLILIRMNVRKATAKGKLYDLVNEHRAGTQILVQIISHVLGLAHVFVLTTCLNHATRLLIEKRRVSLDCLQWWNSMCSLRIDWDLPLKLWCISILFVTASFLPAALWAGAITPVLTTTELPLEAQVPIYRSDLLGSYCNNSWAPFPMPINYTDRGSFSYSPAVSDSGSILKNAAAAISANTSFAKHSRNDLTQYFYNGRSYGVGASPGLAELDHANIISYTYNETGYQTSVTCMRNMSSQWGWRLVINVTDLVDPDIWYARGIFPDGETDVYAQVGWGIKDMVSMTTRISTEAGLVMIAGGKHYSSLNYTQCIVDFNPASFLVAADVVQKTINVSVNVQTANVADMDPTTNNGPFQTSGCGRNFTWTPYTSVGRRGLGLIASQVLHGVTSLTQINTSLRNSIVGDTLQANIQNAISAQKHHLIDSKLSQDDTNLTAIATSLESIIDDILVGLSSSQIVIANSTESVPALASVGAVRLSEATSIYMITALNIVLVLILIAKLFRTSSWRNLLLFDYRDVKSVAIATSAKGSALAEYAHTEHGRTQTKWLANPADRKVGNIRVKLARAGQGLALALDNSTEEVQLLPRRRVTGKGPWTYEHL